MIIFNYSEDDLVKADGRAHVMVENGLYNRFGCDMQRRIDHARTGCLGEIVFERYLTEHNIRFEIDRDNFEEQNADEFDFEIDQVKIDIKVALTTRTPLPRWTFGYPVQQIGMEKDIVVVGWVNTERHEVGFYGWIPFEKIRQCQITNVNTFGHFRYQTPNYEFRWSALCHGFDNLLTALINNRNNRNDKIRLIGSIYETEE